VGGILHPDPLSASTEIYCSAMKTAEQTSERGEQTAEAGR
jgi:hypothetical protein